MIYENIDGWFDYQDVYDGAINKYKDSGHFVEVGCWLGKSGCYLLEKCLELKANITVDFVDIWQGESRSEHQQEALNKNGRDYQYKEFVKNISLADPNYNGRIYTSNSIFASQLYEDKSLDFVFIDGDHRYKYCLEDIRAWFTKVKIGGMLAGHDYNNEFNVIKAVKECFGDRFRIAGSKECPTWVYEKGENEFCQPNAVRYSNGRIKQYNYYGIFDIDKAMQKKLNAGFYFDCRIAQIIFFDGRYIHTDNYHHSFGTIDDEDIKMLMKNKDMVL